MPTGTPLDRIYRRLILIDAILALAAWVVAWGIRRSLDMVTGRPVSPLENHLLLLLLVIPLWLAASASRGLYRRPSALGAFREFQHLLQSAALGLLASMTLSFVFKELEIARAVVFLSSVFYLLFVTFERALVRRWAEGRTKAGRPLVRSAILGHGALARTIRDRLYASRLSGHEPLGYIGTEGTEPDMCPLPRLCDVDRLPQVLGKHGIHEVFVASPDLPPESLLDLISRCHGTGVTFKVAAGLFEVIALQGAIDETIGLPVTELGPGLLSPGESVAKRSMDIILAIVLGILSLPFAAAACLMIKLDSQGPALFKQTRMGKEGELFEMYKFRTMDREAIPFERAPKDDKDPRITTVGRWLRRTSLDELPQIINVIRGEMSFVGPRPEMPFIVEQYHGWQRQRLSVKPGITGLWQIMGRKDLPLEENLEYDFFYIRNQSIFLDIAILIRTIPTVLMGKGAY
jgi:exopolysaccharide biosynthesis polyprenyl glycosylphosphotransferase